MTEAILTASVSRTGKRDPLTVSVSATTYGNVLPVVVRYRHRSCGWDEEHPEKAFIGVDLAIPASDQYEDNAADFTYPVMLRIGSKQAALTLAATLTRIAASFDTPWQDCRGCAEAYPAPCLSCAMADASVFAEDGVQ